LRSWARGRGRIGVDLGGGVLFSIIEALVGGYEVCRCRRRTRGCADGRSGGIAERWRGRLRECTRERGLTCAEGKGECGEQVGGEDRRRHYCSGVLLLLAKCITCAACYL